MYNRDYKTKYYRLNNRARITITPLTEYSYVKGYDIKLEYRVKSKFINKYIWLGVNSININGELDVNSSDFKYRIDMLLNRKNKEMIKVSKDISLLKKVIKESYERI